MAKGRWRIVWRENCQFLVIQPVPTDEWKQELGPNAVRKPATSRRRVLLALQMRLPGPATVKFEEVAI